MSDFFSSIKWQFALVYLDKTAIFSKTLKQHIKHVRKVFLLLSSAGAALKLNKCSFHTDTATYPRHAIRFRKLELAFHTTDERNT